MAPPIHILRPGTFRSRGADHTFAAEDLTAIAAAYDPALHEAPIVVGHPRDDTPAFGWVAALVADAAGLHASPRQVDPAFAEAVEAGRYKKVSAAFYGPDHPSSPAPGAWYLRHVGFLGGQPPVVKGLAAVQLADDGADCAVFELELAEGAEVWHSIARLFRGVREWIISERDADAADKAVPDWEIDFLNRAAEHEPAGTATYSEPAGSPTHTEEAGMTDEEKAAQAALKQENADLKAQMVQHRTDTAAAKTRTAKHEAVQFAESLESEGRLLPRDRDAVVALQMALPEDAEVELSEDDDAEPVKKPAREVLRELLKRAPVQVDFTERAPGTGGDGSGSNVVDFVVPAGRTVDPDGMEIHRKAVAFAEENKVDYDTAVDTVIARAGRSAR